MFGFCLLVACSGDTSSASGSNKSLPAEPPSTASTHTSAGPTTTASVPTATSFERVAVRLDKATFEEKRLGTVRFDEKPPFLATVVEGDDALRALVKEMNALDHVMSAGVLGPPQRIVRSEDQFFRIMQFGWLRDTHGVDLRIAGKQGAPVRRLEVMALDDGKNVHLGTVEMNDVHYLAIVAGPTDQRARLHKLLKEMNDRTAESVDVPPPNGQRGKWGRSVERGTAAFLPMLRDRLYKGGALLVPEGRKRPEELKVEGRASRYGGRWLSVHVPGGFTVVPPEKEVELHLAGPPGGPLSFRVLRYDNVKYDGASLKAYVQGLHGKAPAFAEGEVGEVEIASRKLLALPFRTGEGPATAFHLIALWPAAYQLSGGDKIRDEGVAIELTRRGSDAKPTIEAVMNHDDFVTLSDSLFVDLDLGS